MVSMETIHLSSKKTAVYLLCVLILSLSLPLLCTLIHMYSIDIQSPNISGILVIITKGYMQFRYGFFVFGPEVYIFILYY